jgi:hypothetical protein
MSVSLRIRRDTAVNWEALDPVLFQGELGMDLTNKRIKLGDGFTEWASLDFVNDTQFAELRTEYGNETDFQIYLELSKL